MDRCTNSAYTTVNTDDDELENSRMDEPQPSKLRVGKWITLAVLTLIYVVGELSHFLLSIVTRPMSQELQYGPKACISASKFTYLEIPCYEANNSVSCSSYGAIENTTDSACEWNYSGLGYEYQILAGPAFIAVFSISGIIFGILSDKYSRKIVVSACLVVLTLATLLTGIASKYWHLVVFRMMIGAGESSFSPACSSMISDIFLDARRGFALGIFNWGIYLGYGLSYAIGNLVTTADIAGLGWRFSYFTAGAIGVVAVLLTLIIVKEPVRGERKTEINEELKETPRQHIDSSHSADLQNESHVEESKMKAVMKTVLNPPFLILTIAACIRHTAGFTWAYNTQSYFTTYYPQYNLGFWISGVSIIGGSCGVAIGGFVSDKLVVKLGLRARLYVLAGSQLLATPFAFGVLSFSPPYAFYCLVCSYLFAEMWFGVLFAVLLELTPTHIQSTTIAVFLFIMNNVGGNAPVAVAPLRQIVSYRTALYIMYPCMYFISAIIFFVTSLFIKKRS